MGKQLSSVLRLSLVLLAFICLALPLSAAEQSAKGLHRIDFRLEKASCATCIKKVRDALRVAPGVFACEIAFRKPYGAVVIFDPAKINFSKMQDLAKKADPKGKVELAEPLEEAASGVPTLLIPKYNNLKKSP